MCGDPQGLVIRTGFTIPYDELLFSFAASSGPGGQKVNKTETKVHLKWCPAKSAALEKSLSPSERERLLKRAESHLNDDGAVQIISSRFRTREANRSDCLEKLATKIRAWLKKPKKRIPTKPTRAAKERRLKEKKRISSIKKNRQRPVD